MANSEFNIQDYWDFDSLDGVSAEDEAAILAAIIEDFETASIQPDTGLSSSQEHYSIARTPGSATEGGVLHLDVTIHATIDMPTGCPVGRPETTAQEPAPPVPDEAYCGICMERKPPTEFFDTKFCTHLYCNECVGSYVTDKIQDGIGWVNCPEPGCEAGFLDPGTCHPMLPQHLIDRWGNLVCEAMIQVKFYCPYKDCSALLMNAWEDGYGDGEEEIIVQSECPHCKRLFCAQCQSAWHEGVECEEGQKLDFLGREREDMMLKEVAESSQTRAQEPAPPVPEEAYCGICMERKTLTEFFDTKFCTHLYCNECVGSYVADKIQDGIGWINCPEPGCEAGFLDPGMCHPMLPQRLIDRWGDLVCEAMIQVKFYCPYKDCSALLMNDQEDGDGKEEIIVQSECPHCNRLFCAQCLSPWHDGVECEEVQKLGAGDRQREDLMLKEVAESSQWQRCPECQFFVERNEGCNHITCRCKYEFCYRCGAKWKSSHYGCTGAK